MSMPLGVIAYSGAASQPARPKVPKEPKPLKAEKSPKPSRQLHDSTESSSLIRLPQIFKRRASVRSANKASSRNPLTTLLDDSSSGSPLLDTDASVLHLARSKHIPIVIPDYTSDLHPLLRTSTSGSNRPDQAIAGNTTRPDNPLVPISPSNLSRTLPKYRPRHVELAAPHYPQSYLSNSSHPKDRLSTIDTLHSNPFTSTEGMSFSEASSRTSTLDSRTSAPSPNQLSSRKGSSAQLSINSSQSSIAGRDEYAYAPAPAPEQDPLPTSTSSASFYQARSTGASPAISTPGQSSNLSGLVCNVHRTTGKEPPALVGATTTILGDKLYVFGGRRISRSRPNLTSDLYELDLLRRHWVRLETKGDIPSPRYFHSVCALGDNKLVCYGGMSPEPTAAEPGLSQGEEPQVTVMSDIHIYDVPSRTWMEVPTAKSPQGRYAHCAAILPSSAVFTSANAPVSAIHHNPSGDDPHQGSLGLQIDGTGGAEMIVVGGQDSNNRYIEQISVFNLRSLSWTSTQPMSGRSCGAYRSVVTPLTTMSAAKIGAGPGRPDEDYDDDGDDDGEDADPSVSGSPMLVYTNYNFLDVKLELQVRLPDGSLVDKPMQGTVTPPGLRFPNGGIIDNHFVVAGTFLTSSKQEFSLWALDLRTLAWSRIDTGSTIFSQGSWNRGVLWQRRNAFVIMGNRKRNLVDDYNNRRLNFSNLCIVQLEAFGLYDNPRKSAPTSDYVSGSAPPNPPQSNSEAMIGGRQLSAAAESLGEMSMAARELADTDLLAIDGTRIPINSRLVARRWGPYFNVLLRDSVSAVDSSGTDTATLRPAPSIVPSRNSSITITPSLNSNATTLTANTGTSADPADTRALPPNSRPRTLYLPHTVPTLQALVHFLYTSSLPPLSSHLATPQIFCSLLQLARPYNIDGLLEAVIERLHETLDGRNAAAIFNAAAMGAGGGKGVHFASPANSHPPRTASLAGIEGLSISNGGLGRGVPGTLRIDTDVANGIPHTNALATDGRSTRSTMRRASEAVIGIPGSAAGDDDDMDIPDSASTTNSLGSQLSLASMTGRATRREDREVWEGGWSAVIGLQKRGLRGLMEGRRARERGVSNVRHDSTPPGAQETRIGLGIA